MNLRLVIFCVLVQQMFARILNQRLLINDVELSPAIEFEICKEPVNDPAKDYCGEREKITEALLFQLEKNTLTDAVRGCEEHGLVLAYVLDKTENKVITEAISNLDISEGKFRIGLKKSDNGDYQWTSINDRTDYAQHMVRESAKPCVAINYRKDGQSFEWVSVDCTEPLPSICRENKLQKTGINDGVSMRAFLPKKIENLIIKMWNTFFGFFNL